MGPKYELYEPNTPKSRGETKLRYRIRALRDIPVNGIAAGELGGWVDGEHNLVQTGTSWIFKDAKVCDNAVVSGNAIVQGKHAIIGGNAKISGSAVVTGSCVFNEAIVTDRAIVVDSVIEANAVVCGNAKVMAGSTVRGAARVFENAVLTRRAEVSGEARISGSAIVVGPAHIADWASVKKLGDYAVYTAVWDYGKSLTYTRSNKMWCAKGFLGTGEDLIKEAYKLGTVAGRCTEAIVGAQEIIDREMERKQENP